MKRKKIVVAVIALVLLGGYTAGIYAQPAEGVTRTQMESPELGKNREEIAESVLRDTGRSDVYDLNELQNVTVYYGDVTTGPERDAVVTVSFGPNDTVVAAYTPEGGVYQFVGDIGQFEGVQNIQFIPVPSEGRDVVIVRETSDQAIGAHEATEQLRGYLYTGGESEGGEEFSNVLQTTQQIQSIWNALWNTEEGQNLDNWLKVTENTESGWKLGGEIPLLEITRYQEYLKADSGQNELIPQGQEFESDAKRVIVERYYWSNEWNRFILGEATDKATGEKVAVIENRDASPYFLAGFRDDSFLIQRRDGSEDIIKDSGLEWLTEHP